MLGAIYGDIAGSKYEFHNIRTKNFELLTDDCYFTDDSVLTIGVANMLLKHYPMKYDQESLSSFQKDLIKEFASLFVKYPLCGFGGMFANWCKKALCGMVTPYHSYGNGAAMRISPVAYVASSEEELKLLSKAITEITHNHPEGIKGAEVTAMCIYKALRGESKASIKKYAISMYPEIATFNYEHLRNNYMFNETCQETVPQAIYCFLISKSFKDCIKTTISIGGDCDTSSAISGAIAEAYYGMSEDDMNDAKSFLPSAFNKIIMQFYKSHNLKNDKVLITTTTL